MSIQTQLFAQLQSIFTGRFYPAIAPDKTALPYGVYSRISAVEQATLDSNGGEGNNINTRLQIDIYAATYLAAQSAAQSVKTAMKSWTVTNIVDSEQDFYEPETKLYRVMLDFSAWHD